MMPAWSDSYFNSIADTWLRQGIVLEPGLTDSEIEIAESSHAFRFPPDLKALLQHVLPVGAGFPNWREPNSEKLLGRLSWPLDSMCFDIENDEFWPDEWGAKPVVIEDAFAIAAKAVSAAPFLIPVFSHRYLPATPYADGNPVLSVYQTDIIYYGFDLPDYLAKEFSVPNPFAKPDRPRRVPFWIDIIEGY